MVIYLTTRDGSWTNPWGQRLQTNRLRETTEVTEVGTWQRDTGYGSTWVEKTYEDADGNLYRNFSPIDYSAQSYMVDDEGAFWHRRVATPAIDMEGYPIDRYGNRLI